MGKKRPRLRLRHISRLYACLCAIWQCVADAEWMAITRHEYGLWTRGMGRLFHARLRPDRYNYSCLEGTWRGYEECRGLELPEFAPRPGRGPMGAALANTDAAVWGDEKQCGGLA